MFCRPEKFNLRAKRLVFCCAGKWRFLKQLKKARKHDGFLCNGSGEVLERIALIMHNPSCRWKVCGWSVTGNGITCYSWSRPEVQIKARHVKFVTLVPCETARLRITPRHLYLALNLQHRDFFLLQINKLTRAYQALYIADTRYRYNSQKQ